MRPVRSPGLQWPQKPLRIIVGRVTPRGVRCNFQFFTPPGAGVRETVIGVNASVLVSPKKQGLRSISLNGDRMMSHPLLRPVFKDGFEELRLWPDKAGQNSAETHSLQSLFRTVSQGWNLIIRDFSLPIIPKKIEDRLAFSCVVMAEV